MKPELAVNYSQPAAELLCDGHVFFDRFKCPAWPDLVATACKAHPTYVHFSLMVGAGIDDAIDLETGQPADWGKVEALLAQTDTPLINLHFAPSTTDYPDLHVDTIAPDHVEMLTERALRDVHAVVERFGPEMVIIENDHDGWGQVLRPVFLPETIRSVIEETGCGLLLDLSHARLAAHCLGMDARAYIEALPVRRTREIHVTGIHRFEEGWVERMLEAGVDVALIQRFEGRLVDHLPMTNADWAFFAWAMDQVRGGGWGQPWVVTFEYGGVSRLYEAVTDERALAEQIPRLYTLIRSEHH